MADTMTTESPKISGSTSGQRSDFVTIMGLTRRTWEDESSFVTTKTLMPLLQPSLFLISLCAPILNAEQLRAPIYPFDVKVNGQLAVIEETNPELAIFAKVKDPVPANAEIEVVGAGESIVINVFPVLETGEVTEDAAAKTKIILNQNGEKTVKLDNTLDGSKLDPGLYGMNIAFGGKTSRVMFTVE
ncbi:MAG: hypothetical protein ACFCU3_05465 [Verrucomicrobiales bacterium]